MNKIIISLVLAFSLPHCSMAQDIFSVSWSVDQTKYEAALVQWNNDNAVMRVKFFANGYWHLVEETMRGTEYERGYLLTGSNPVIPGTGSSADYFADNIYIYFDENGHIHCFLIDTDLNSSACVIRLYTDYDEKQELLARFNWTL